MPMTRTEMCSHGNASCEDCLNETSAFHEALGREQGLGTALKHLTTIAGAQFMAGNDAEAQALRAAATGLEKLVAAAGVASEEARRPWRERLERAERAVRKA